MTLEAFKKKGVDPQVIQVILMEEQLERLEEQSKQLDRMISYNEFRGPMERIFPRERIYQYQTIQPNTNGQVFILRNPQPDLLVGIITQVANNWYPQTHLEWITDYESKRVEHIIGQIDAPKHYERGLPFRHEVEWIAYNEDTVSHVFEVLCDGFFIRKEVFDKVVGT